MRVLSQRLVWEFVSNRLLPITSNVVKAYLQRISCEPMLKNMIGRNSGLGEIRRLEPDLDHQLNFILKSQLKVVCFLLKKNGRLTIPMMSWDHHRLTETIHDIIFDFVVRNVCVLQVAQKQTVYCLFSLKKNFNKTSLCRSRRALIVSIYTEYPIR